MVKLIVILGKPLKGLNKSVIITDQGVWDHKVVGVALAGDTGGFDWVLVVKVEGGE